MVTFCINAYVFGHVRLPGLSVKGAKNLVLLGCDKLSSRFVIQVVHGFWYNHGVMHAYKATVALTSSSKQTDRDPSVPGWARL